MTNEEFQNLVLEKLGNLETGQKNLETSVSSLEAGQKNLETSVSSLEAGQKNLETSVSSLEAGQKNLETSVSNLEKGQKNLEASVSSLETGQKDLEVIVKGLEKSLGAVAEQTADLTEFRQEVKENLHTLLEENISIHGILGEHEVSIRTMRRMII